MHFSKYKQHSQVIGLNCSHFFCGAYTRFSLHSDVLLVHLYKFYLGVVKTFETTQKRHLKQISVLSSSHPIFLFLFGQKVVNVEIPQLLREFVHCAHNAFVCVYIKSVWVVDQSVHLATIALKLLVTYCVD